MKIPKLWHSSLLVTSLITLNLSFNFLTKVVTAYLFGAGWEVDVYLIALAVPLFIRTVCYDAIGAVIIPLMYELKSSGPVEKLQNLKITVVSVTSIVSGVILLLGVLVNREIVLTISPGLVGARADLAAELTQILMISTSIFLVTGVFIVFLYFERRFLYPHLVILIQPILIITFGFLFTPVWGIKSLAIGQLVGSAIQALILVPFSQQGLIKSGLVRFEKTFMYRFLKQTPLAAISLLPLPFVPIVDRYFTSSFPEGSVSYISYSWTITVAISAVMARGISTVLLPHFSDMTHRDPDGLRQSIGQIVRFFLYFSTPLVVTLLLVRKPFVELLLVRGSFTYVDAESVAALMCWHLIGVLGLSVFQIVSRVYYSLSYFRLSAVFGALFLVGYPGITYICGSVWGLSGIAIGNMLAWIGLTLLVLYALHVKRILIDLAQMGNLFLKVLVSSCIAFYTTRWVMELWKAPSNVLDIVLTGLVVAVVYGLVSAVLLRVYSGAGLWK